MDYVFLGIDLAQVVKISCSLGRRGKFARTVRAREIDVGVNVSALLARKKV